jgi:DNA-binding transcriptional LysR family regulator
VARTAKKVLLDEEIRKEVDTQSGVVNERRKIVLSGSHSVTGGIGSSRYRCRTIRDDVRGRLRVNVDATFARFILAPHLGRFLKTYPELSLEIAVRDRLGDPEQPHPQLLFEALQSATHSGLSSSKRFPSPNKIAGFHDRRKHVETI